MLWSMTSLYSTLFEYYILLGNFSLDISASFDKSQSYLSINIYSSVDLYVSESKIFSIIIITYIYTLEYVNMFSLFQPLDHLTHFFI
jgi:hypothetical protein